MMNKYQPSKWSSNYHYTGNLKLRAYIQCDCSRDVGDRPPYGEWIDLMASQVNFNDAVARVIDNSPHKEHPDFDGEFTVTAYEGFGKEIDQEFSKSKWFRGIYQMEEIYEFSHAVMESPDLLKTLKDLFARPAYKEVDGNHLSMIVAGKEIHDEDV